MVAFSSSSSGNSRYGSVSISAASPPALGGAVRPSAVDGTEPASDWNSNQRALTLLERAPIVWCRRIGDSCGNPSDDGIGGVLVSPGATACRFDTPILSGQPVANAVAVKWRLVVSQGRLGGISVNSVFQGRCRVGSFSQSYSPNTAGTWTPGNFLVDVYSGAQLIANRVQAPTQCGTVGTHKGLTTVSFSAVNFNGFDGDGVGLPDRGHWKRQIHLFIRNGVESTRLLDNVYGSSNNLGELYLYLLNSDNRTAAVQIDRESITAAARFMDVNKLFWNGVLEQPTSISDWMGRVGPYFMVRETKIAGRYGLRPLLPVTPSGDIDTGPLRPEWVFNSEAIMKDSYSWQLVDSKTRQPYNAVAAWRQQGAEGLSRMTRTTPIAYDDTPDDAPTEEHDLYQFATHIKHAAMAMRFGQAKRRYVTHTATVTIKAPYWNSRLGEGELIELQLLREDVDGVASPLIEWYWVVGTKTAREGALSLELEHCPTDQLGRSLVARDVAAIQAENVTLLTGDSAPSCDADSSRATDCSIPALDQQSWTEEEVWFFGLHGRRPESGEYEAGGFAVGGGGGRNGAPPPAPPGGAGGGGGGRPTPSTPTGPVSPAEPPQQPMTPEGPAEPPAGRPSEPYTTYSLFMFFTLIDREDWYFVDYSSFAQTYTYRYNIPVSPGGWAAITDKGPEKTVVASYDASGTLVSTIEFSKAGVFTTLVASAYKWEFSTLIPGNSPDIGVPP